MSASIKDAKPGERWEFFDGKHVAHGQVVAINGGAFMAWGTAFGATICALDDLRPGWKKVANADGTPYEEPKPLPDFGECWAARDRDGEAVLTSTRPFLPHEGSTCWDTHDDSLTLKGMSFRPELPWDKTACKVRVRLEVVE